MRTSSVLLGSAAAIAAALTMPACTNGSGAADGGASGGPPGGGDDASAIDGANGGDAGGDPTAAGALPASTFLYVSKIDADHDVLVAVDMTTGEQRTVTDLRGDGSDGWTIRGYSLSPDRTRIALASNFGPTKEDNDTKLATRRIWSLAVDGSDFRRLTPVFENTGGVRTTFSIEVDDPSFSRDGSNVLFDYGEYWYEGTSLEGGAGLFSVASQGGALPALFKAPNPCSVLDASADPKTGKVAAIHSVCIPGQGTNGIYLYAEDGSGTPELLVPDTGKFSPTPVTPRWVADGSGFVFIATTEVPANGTTKMVRGLFVFDMTSRETTPIVVPETDELVIDATIAPDASAIVYCLRHGDATDLHLIDLTVDPPTDAAITNDGKSCHPVW